MGDVVTSERAVDGVPLEQVCCNGNIAVEVVDVDEFHGVIIARKCSFENHSRNESANAAEAVNRHFRHPVD